MKWGVYGVPETFLVDADGTILLRHAGPIDRRVLDEVLLPAIGRLP
jgi:cytochrome c biogenesis protein CcmG/thiol:disulfide interchange protein DsbE